MHKERFVWLDSLRIVAGVSMVGLHATTDSNGLPFPMYEAADRWLPMLLRWVIYTARTELFLIISLFLLCMSLEQRPRSYGDVLKEQSRRLVPPFIFWAVFFAFYNLLKSNAFGYQGWVLTQLKDPKVWLEYLLLGTSKYHMHFIPTLFGLVLLYPIYRIAVRHPWLGCLVFCMLMIKRESDGFLWSTYADNAVLPWMLRGVKILTYCGYGFVAAAAYGVWKRSYNLRPYAPYIACAGGVLFIIKLYVTHQTVIAGEWQYANGAGYWADFLMPAVLFILVMAFAHKEWPSAFSHAAKYSFGIYLCHPIFLDLVEVCIRQQAFSPTQQVFVKISLTLPLTALFVIALSNTRLFAWTIGLGRLPQSIVHKVGRNSYV